MINTFCVAYKLKTHIFEAGIKKNDNNIGRFPGGGLGNQKPARTIAHSPPGVKETLNYMLREKWLRIYPGHAWYRNSPTSLAVVSNGKSGWPGSWQPASGTGPGKPGRTGNYFSICFVFFRFFFDLFSFFFSLNI